MKENKLKAKGICNWWLHEERYGKESVELIGYCWFNERLISDEGNVELAGERDKLEYCQKCYDYNSPLMIERSYREKEKVGFGFNPMKWFWFYEDDEKQQAIENGRQKDYYHQQKAPYHKTISLLKEDIELSPFLSKKEFAILYKDKGQIIDLYIGDFGVRYCISCSVKAKDNSDKKLIMSLDNAKLCYSCGMKKAVGLVDGSNPNLIIKEKKRKSNEERGTISQWWEVVDKQTFSQELKTQLAKIYDK